MKKNEYIIIIHTTVDRAVIIIINFLATYDRDQLHHMSVLIRGLYDLLDV